MVEKEISNRGFVFHRETLVESIFLEIVNDVREENLMYRKQLNNNKYYFKRIRF